MKKSLSILEILEASLKDLQSDKRVKKEMEYKKIDLNFSSLASIIEANFTSRLSLINYLETSRCNLFDNKLDQYDQQTQHNIKHLELMLTILQFNDEYTILKQKLRELNDDQAIIDYLSKFINKNLDTAIKEIKFFAPYYKELINDLEAKGVISYQPDIKDVIDINDEQMKVKIEKLVDCHKKIRVFKQQDDLQYLQGKISQLMARDNRMDVKTMIAEVESLVKAVQKLQGMNLVERKDFVNIEETIKNLKESIDNNGLMLITEKTIFDKLFKILKTIFKIVNEAELDINFLILQIENLKREIVELEALQKIRNKKIEEINAKRQERWTQYEINNLLINQLFSK
jgi:hypothetical protein